MTEHKSPSGSSRSFTTLTVAALIGMALGGIWVAVFDLTPESVGLLHGESPMDAGRLLLIAGGAVVGGFLALVLLSTWTLAFGKATSPWHRRVSWALLLLFGSACLFVVLMDRGRDRVRLDRFFRIKAGMPRQEVERLLGPPTDYTHGTVGYELGVRVRKGGQAKLIYDDWGGPVRFTSAKEFKGTSWFGSEGALVVCWDKEGNVETFDFYCPAGKPALGFLDRLKATVGWR